jgi:hypothetical protein
MAKIVLISCVKRKLKGAKNVPAKDMYNSPLFKKAWAYAKSLNSDKIYILSAKHGLLNPDTKIDYYDESLVNASVSKRKEWTDKVLTQMKDAGLDTQNDTFIFLAGKAYYDYLQKELTNCEFPYAGKGSIGYILQFLTQELKSLK